MEELRRIINDLDTRLQKLERGIIIKNIVITADGSFIPKVVSSDPTSPKTNEAWINSSTHQLKYFDGATIRVL